MRGRERFAFTVASEPDASHPGCHQRPAEVARTLVEWPRGRSLVLDLHPIAAIGSERASHSRTDTAITARGAESAGAAPSHLAALICPLPHVAAGGSMLPRGCTHSIASRAMPDLDLSNRTLGEFVLRERIGVGGHGTVYRCEQRALGRDAVVKVLRPRKTNDAQAERFVREAKLASRLDHPYSAHVYDFGVEDDGVRWIAMELVHGVSLGDWLKARGPMPLAQFVPFFELIAEVVHAAHLRGIVHRDLKPSNIMMIESGARWLPKLLDFGIARIFDATSGTDEELPEDEHGGAAVTTARLRPEPPPYRTRTGPDEEAVRLTPLGAVLGSTPYMSPEQWKEPWSVGPAADVYALGCLAHEALTGRTPFKAEHASGYRDLHLGAQPPSLGDAFPPGVDDA